MEKYPGYGVKVFPVIKDKTPKDSPVNLLGRKFIGIGRKGLYAVDGIRASDIFVMYLCVLSAAPYTYCTQSDLSVCPVLLAA
jgi:hypothetical protein